MKTKEDKNYKMHYTADDIDFKELDKSTFLWCIFMLFIGIVIMLIFSTISVGGSINFASIFQIIGQTFVVFSLCFIGITIVFIIIFGLLRLLFKSEEDVRVNYYIKIVICAIAVVLFLTYTIINYDSTQLTPQRGTEELLIAQIKNPGVEGCTDRFTFSKDLHLAGDSVVRYTGISQNQLFFVNPYGISVFTIKTEELSDVLIYNAQFKSVLKICVICGKGRTKLQEALDAHSLGVTIDSPIENKTLCAVYPKVI